MSKLVNGRVKTLAAARIPKLHTLEPPVFLPDYVTQATSHHQRSSASIAEDILSADDGDFLTRRLTLASEKGHIINTVRNDITLAARVAESLIDVGIVPVELHESFHLEHVSNLICIADGLHPLFDTYGTFAYVPSDASMDELLTIVKNLNEDLQQTIDNIEPWTSRKTRYIMERIDSQFWAAFTYEIAILLPDHFLPFEQELLIRDPTAPNISYSRTRVIDKELRIIHTQPDTEPVIYPPFSHSTARSEGERVNPFFVLINASDKYSRHCVKYGSETMSPRVNALFQKATEIVALIFAEFEPVSGSIGAEIKAKKSEGKRKREQGKEANKDSRGGRHTRSRLDGGSTEATGGSESEAIEGGESEAFGNGESEEAMHDQKSDFGSDVDETSRTPGADGGVAFFDAITEELKNPGLSAKERVRLHMLQLFGGKDYKTPHIPGVPDPPSVFDRISNGDYNAYERAH